jgi:uracil phosphoribosyltransferase
MTRPLCGLNGVHGKRGRYDAETMAPLTVLEHPLAGDLLTRLRDRDTGPAEYRSLARRLGRLLVIEATCDLPTQPHAIRTPLEAFEGTRVATGVVVIPVLRAGLGLLDAVVDLYPDAVVGYLGMERDEETHEPRDYYAKLPPMQGRRALVVDPMLATGGSGCAAVRYVKEAGAKDIVFMCVVAAPEGVARMHEEHPDVPVVAAALDRELDANAYILPGLGDFGDRLYGTL